MFLIPAARAILLAIAGPMTATSLRLSFRSNEVHRCLPSVRGGLRRGRAGGITGDGGDGGEILGGVGMVPDVLATAGVGGQNLGPGAVAALCLVRTLGCGGARSLLLIAGLGRHLRPPFSFIFLPMEFNWRTHGDVTQIGLPALLVAVNIQPFGLSFTYAASMTLRSAVVGGTFLT